jgi:hypothetical protein
MYMLLSSLNSSGIGETRILVATLGAIYQQKIKLSRGRRLDVIEQTQKSL